MSYNTIFASSNDPALRGRITAACAQERPASDDPNALMMGVLWNVVTASDVESAYASALAAQNPNPGGDESVISDGMILANVQPNLPAEEEAEA